MKKIIVISIILFATNIYAQSTSPKKIPTQNDTTEHKKTIKYCCIRGDYSNIKPGLCPIDNTTLLMEGVYYCKVCDAAGYKSGKCPKCANSMVKMECPEIVIKDRTEPIEKNGMKK